MEGEPEAVTEYINRLCAEAAAAGKKTGVIGTDETFSSYACRQCEDGRKPRGRRGDCRSLYRILREFDDEEVEVMYSESFSTYGMGQAIMNRLLKAAGYRVITV